jgi:putative radical SAM enzyme (TIGR03279 family)
MAFPQVVAVAHASSADRAGVEVGDEIRSMNGTVPRDVIAYQLLADEAVVELEVARGGLVLELVAAKHAGEPLGIEVSSAVFDRIRTCDNHCEFCFIYQLPKGMRRSLYVKDDDYRLSFLYGNFTTLTRFTELDLERVVTERLSPLNVSIHATDPDVRSRMLRNPRGATSLRWLRALLDHGIEVHGQIVVCPGVNDGAVLHDTLAGILERFPELATAAAVPLGVSRYTKEPAMRPHTTAEAAAVVDAVEQWQGIYLGALGRRVVQASDEYYLLAGRPFPPAEQYDGFPQHENGIGMATAFAEAFRSGRRIEDTGHGGFFQSVDGAPAAGYRAARVDPGAGASVAVPLRGRSGAAGGHRRCTVLTGEYGARVLAPLLLQAGRGDVEFLVVDNAFFGVNSAVAGLMTGADLCRVLAGADPDRRYLLPDVCLNEGRFLDGLTPGDLPVAVEVVETDGAALRRAIGAPVARTRAAAAARSGPGGASGRLAVSLAGGDR